METISCVPKGRFSEDVPSTGGPQEGSKLSVCGSSEGLPAMSCKNRMSAAETEATIRGSDDDQPVYLRARERNESEAYRREMKRRQATVEGVFASLDRLGKMQVEGAVESRL